MDIGQSPQHATKETHCPSCGVPESAGAGQHGMDCRAIEQANQRLVILDVIADHRRVRNVRSCSARHCAWRPERSGNTSNPEDTLARHHQFNQHLADVIVDRLAQL